MADEVNLSRQSLRELAEIMGSNQRMTRTSTTGGDGGGGGGSLKAMYDEVQPTTFAFRAMKEAYASGSAVYNRVNSVIEENIGTWQTLSKSGLNFSNDLGAIAVANDSMRLTQQEFQEVMADNSKRFGALGGSATRGAEAFVKLSKSMFDSGAMEGLTQLGISTKDINEAMAIQIGMQGSTIANDAKSKERIRDSTVKLVTEMDTLSKLTGLSRKEQEEKIKQAQIDGAIENKFRLIGIQQGADAEKAARDGYLKQLMAAQATGTDEVFKAGFSGVGIQSEKAQNQMLATQGAGMAAFKQGAAVAQGDIESASKYSKQAFAETQKNAKNVGLIMQGITDSSGALGTAINDTTMKTKAYTEAAAAIRKEEEFRNKTEAEIHDEALKRVAKAQAGQDATGEQVDGVKNAAVALKNRIGDVNSSFQNGLIIPLMKTVAPRLQYFADTTLSPGVRDKSGKFTGEQFATKTENELREAYKGTVRKYAETDQEGGGGGGGGRRQPSWRDQEPSPGGGTSNITGAIGSIVGNIAAITTQTVDKLIIASPLPAPFTRGTGTIGETGFPTEIKDVVAQLHKGEMVLTPEQQKNFLTNAKGSGIQDVMSKMASIGNKMANDPDMQALVQDVKTKMQNQTETATSAGSISEFTLSDVVKQLETLNKTMTDMMTQTEMIGDRHIKATKGLSGNMFA